MDGLRFLGIALLAISPVLGVVALAVRYAGARARPLTGVDYHRVHDAAALHRWAGRRLAILPATAFLLGLASLRMPGLALPLTGLFALVSMVVGAWIALGAERFNRPT